MPIIQRRFKGVRPRVNPRLLAADEATTAVNVKLWNGKLRPYKRSKFDYQTVKTGPIRSIFKYRGGGKEGWFHWANDVDVVRAPLAGDAYGRVYYTGDGRPKLTDSTLALNVERMTAAGAFIGDNTITLVGGVTPHQVGDTLRINYDDAFYQNVTISSITPSGANIVVGVTPNLSSNLGTPRPVTNISGRMPLASYDLGVPQPASALTTVATAGAGVTTGTIQAIEDIVIFSDAVEQMTTVGDVQDGDPPAIDNHLLGTNFSVDADGQPMQFNLKVAVGVRIRHSNETRDIDFHVVLDPGPSQTKLFSTNNHIVRPAGVGSFRTGSPAPFLDWVYECTCTGIHTPTPGTYSYGARITPIAGIAGDDNNSYAVAISWQLSVRLMTRIKMTLGSGHGLVAGDRITLHVEDTEDTPTDLKLDGRTIEVIDADGADVIVAGLPGGVYNLDGATWTQGTDVDEELTSRTYVYTYVAAIAGQEFEGGPSQASPVIEVTDGQPVTLTGFINPTSPLLLNTNFTVLRIYRFQPDESGGGNYLFLTELPLNTTTYQDTVPSESLAEVLSTTGYELPPVDLAGLIELPEGGAAGFTDKELCFAVPYQLHAYPAAYRRTTHDKIVALGAFGSSVVACTDGTPYVYTGTDPVEMTSERLEIIQPDLSKRGTIDVGYAVIYPSPEGLMLVSVGRADVVTLDWFTSDEWRLLNPSSIVATRYGQRYLGFYDATSMNWPGDDFTDPLPRRGGFIFDPKESSFVFLDQWATDAWTDPKDDSVYIVQQGAIRKWDSDRIELEYRWRSKPFHSSVPIPMALARVEAKRYPVQFIAYADGQTKYVYEVRSRDSFRLPDGAHESWAFEIRGEHEVECVYMASSADELRQVLEGSA